MFENVLTRELQILEQSSTPLALEELFNLVGRTIPLFSFTIIVYRLQDDGECQLLIFHFNYLIMKEGAIAVKLPPQQTTYANLSVMVYVEYPLLFSA